MSLLATCILVLFLYIGVLLGIGLFTARRARTADQFVLGGRNVGPWVTALSFIAVYFSSVVIVGGGSFGYRFGMGTIWIGAINVLVGCTLCWIIMGKRVRTFTERLGVSTISGFFAKRYGSPAAGVFSAVVVAVALVFYNVSVVKGMAHIFEVLMELPYWGGVLISGLVIIFYTVLGGYIAVVWTGFLQAWVMIFALVLLAVRTLTAVGGMSTGMERLAAFGSGYVDTPGVWGWAGLVGFALVVSFGVWGMPQLVIRFYSIKDTRTFRAGTVIVTIGAAIALLPYLTGALSRVLFPDLGDSEIAIPTLVKEVLSNWGAALFLAGVVAAGMSTFAGVLIIISSSVVRDIYREGLGRELTSEQEVSANRIVSAAVGLVSLAVALKPPAMILMLTGYAWAVIASTTLWPLLLGLYWKRASRTAVLVAMVAGAFTAVAWTALKNPWGLHGFVTGSTVSLAAIIVVTLFDRARPGPAVEALFVKDDAR